MSYASTTLSMSFLPLVGIFSPDTSVGDPMTMRKSDSCVISCRFMVPTVCVSYVL